MGRQGHSHRRKLTWWFQDSKAQAQRACASGNLSLLFRPRKSPQSVPTSWRVGPEDIHFAEVHDAFTTFEIIGTEDLGFFPAGKGGDAAAAGKTALDGELPINPSGGLKSRGHPVGASGVAQVVEVVKRLRGETRPKLRRAATRALAQSTGGLGANNFVTIVERVENRCLAQALTPPPQIPRTRWQKSVADEDEGRLETHRPTSHRMDAPWHRFDASGRL
jgi:hypothetical protein